MNRIVKAKGLDDIQFFISIDGYVYDHEIADLLNMETCTYQIYLMENFNAMQDAEEEPKQGLYEDSFTHDVYFINENDAQRALDWINSLFLLLKLGN